MPTDRDSLRHAPAAERRREDHGGATAAVLETPTQIIARRAGFWWVTGLFLVVGVVAGLSTPVPGSGRAAEIWALIFVPPAAVLTLLGLGWLALHLLRRRRPHDSRG